MILAIGGSMGVASGKEARATLESSKPVPPLFYDFAASLFERKVARERIRSAAGRSKWEQILRLHLYPVFGAFRVDDVIRQDVDRWFTGYAGAVKSTKLSPRSANTRLALLRVIYRAASATYGFEEPTEGIERYDTALHPTYTPEEPNSLTPDELPVFLNAMFERCLDHYAVTYLGFVTGLRPSTLFPLRVEDDVRWEQQELWVRRSHTIGQEVMPTTKTGAGYPIGLPKEVLAVPQWHIDTRIEDGPMRVSGLLFPSERGTIRFGGSVGKAFARAALGAGISKRISPRAMRRTFQDISRAAQVESIVKRSISGHATEVMEGWYSTVASGSGRGAGRFIGISTLRPLIWIPSLPRGFRNPVRRGRPGSGGRRPNREALREEPQGWRAPWRFPRLRSHCVALPGVRAGKRKERRATGPGVTDLRPSARPPTRRGASQPLVRPSSPSLGWGAASSRSAASASPLVESGREQDLLSPRVWGLSRTHHTRALYFCERIGGSGGQ